MSQTNGHNRMKLELSLGEEAKVRLLKDRCFEGTNSFGAFYLYSVEHEGVEKAFFAPPEIHRQILESNLKTGDEFVVRKVPVQNGKKTSSRVEVEVLKKAEVPGGHSTASQLSMPRNDDGLKALMAQCLTEAVAITKEISAVPWQNEDIQKIASCLFIARSRMN